MFGRARERARLLAYLSLLAVRSGFIFRAEMVIGNEKHDAGVPTKRRTTSCTSPGPLRCQPHRSKVNIDRIPHVPRVAPCHDHRHR